MASSVDISGLADLDSWYDTYMTLARWHARSIGCHTTSFDDSLTQLLEKDCVTLLQRQKIDVRNGENYFYSKFAASMAAMVPFGRSLAINVLGKEFAAEAMWFFGLQDPDELRNFQNSFKGRSNPVTQLACGLTKLAAHELAKELITDIVVDCGADLVHVKPVIGQILSMGMGYNGMRGRMLKILDGAASRAAVFHVGFVIPQVVHVVRQEMLGRDGARTTDTPRRALDDQPPSMTQRIILPAVEPSPVRPVTSNTTKFQVGRIQALLAMAVPAAIYAVLGERGLVFGALVTILYNCITAQKKSIRFRTAVIVAYIGCALLANITGTKVFWLSILAVNFWYAVQLNDRKHSVK